MRPSLKSAMLKVSPSGIYRILSTIHFIGLCDTCSDMKITIHIYIYMCVCVCVFVCTQYIFIHFFFGTLSLAGWTFLSPHRPRHRQRYDTPNIKRCENSITKHYLNLVSLHFTTNVPSICYSCSEVLQLYHTVRASLSLLLYSGFCSVFCWRYMKCCI